MDFETNLGHHKSVILCVSLKQKAAELFCCSNVCVERCIMRVRLKFCSLDQMVRVQSASHVTVCKLVW